MKEIIKSKLYEFPSSFVYIKTFSLSKPKSDTYKKERTQFDNNI